MRAKPNSNYGSDSEPGSANRTFLIGGHVLNAPKPVPGLYLVATPIGNLGDITLRALETLAGVDIIACEDTRITRRLTERYAISAELKPYHEHNAAIAVPGASSVLTALSVAALPTDRFFFEGFLPAKEVARRTRLAELARIDATLVMFESGNRVQDTLADLSDIMGGRDAAICRELTKLHEDIKRAPIAELAKAADQLETRGEFVLVVGPPRADEGIMTQHDLDDLLRSSLARDSVKDSVAHAVELSGRPRREVYARALELAKEARGDHGED
jgi:16S rRNA (cytidine1402-2'-O)-methyltransferase